MDKQDREMEVQLTIMKSMYLKVFTILLPVTRWRFVKYEMKLNRKSCTYFRSISYIYQHFENKIKFDLNMIDVFLNHTNKQTIE